MYLIEIGAQLRKLRKAAGLSQAQLATLAGVARETVNRLEGGTYNDVGVKKLVTLLDLVGGELVVAPKPKRKSSAPDFVRRSVISANVSHKTRLHADELIQALVTGSVPPGKAGHLQVALEDLSAEARAALIEQVGGMSQDGSKVRSGAQRLREKLQVRS